jgi:hypothetical protein
MLSAIEKEIEQGIKQRRELCFCSVSVQGSSPLWRVNSGDLNA